MPTYTENNEQGKARQMTCQWPGCCHPGETALILSQYQVLCRDHARAERQSTLANDMRVDFMRMVVRIKRAEKQKGAPHA